MSKPHKIPDLIPRSERADHKSPRECKEPTQENLEMVRPGHYLKVRVKAGEFTEAFWVCVDKVDRSRQDNAMVYLGTVDNDLKHSCHGLKCGDKVEVGFQFVLCIMMT